MTTLDWWFESVREPAHIQIARRAQGREGVPARVQEAIDRIRRERGLAPLYQGKEREVA